MMVMDVAGQLKSRLAIGQQVRQRHRVIDAGVNVGEDGLGNVNLNSLSACRHALTIRPPGRQRLPRLGWISDFFEPTLRGDGDDRSCRAFRGAVQ